MKKLRRFLLSKFHKTKKGACEKNTNSIVVSVNNVRKIKHDSNSLLDFRYQYPNDLSSSGLILPPIET